VQTVAEESRELLYRARQQRPAPLRDEKILAAWNGLMISAYARAALALGEEKYAQVAARAASFVLERMRTPDGRLLRSFKDGRARHNAYLADYAFMIAGLLDLYEATATRAGSRRDRARRGARGALRGSRRRRILLDQRRPRGAARAREAGVRRRRASGNSIAVLNLLRLQELTGDDAYRVRAERAFGAFGETLRRSPAALSEMLLAVDWRLDLAKEIVVVTPGARSEAEPFLARLRRAFVPNRVLAVVSAGEVEKIAELVPVAGGKLAQNGAATAYVCERGVCALPTSDPTVFVKQVAKVEPLPSPS
jgi:uncharacterized protein YyaL (SSP411 family)